MNENKTRIYDATYTDKNGSKHNLRVRINTRMVSLFLAFSFVAGATACSIKGHSDKDTKGTMIEIDYQNEDLAAIDEIIKNHPEMLVSKEIVKHTVNYGDTLSEIAEKYGTTVSEIESMNKNVLGSNHILQTGVELKVTKVEKLSELDSEINILESYVFDYFLGKSEVVKIARGEVECEPERALHYKTVMFGDKDASLVDQSSIYGKSIIAQRAYHKEGVEITPERKEIYLNALKDIVELIDRKINLSGNVRAVIPYEEYKTYCQNGNTQYKVEYTPYGDRIVK